MFDSRAGFDEAQAAVHAQPRLGLRSEKIKEINWKRQGAIQRVEPTSGALSLHLATVTQRPSDRGSLCKPTVG